MGGGNGATGANASALPLQQAHVEFVGVESKPLSTMLDQLADRVAAILTEEAGQ